MGVMKWLQGIFTPTQPRHLHFYAPPGTPDPQTYGFRPVGTPEEISAPLKWIPADANPFGIPVLDIRSRTRGTVSTAENRATLQRFIDLRGDHIAESVRDARPENPRDIRCSLQYRLSGELGSGRLFAAPRLEYKWDIARHGGEIIFSRSWSGDVWYRAAISCSPGVLNVNGIQARGADLPAPADDPFDLLTVDFLIRTYVVREAAPHPIGSGFEAVEPKLIATLSFKHIGCDAMWAATVSDLLRLRVKQ